MKHKDKRDPKQWKGFKFAVPFDYSMHNYLLRYFVAEHGLDPDRDIQIRAVPPPEMVANLRADNIDGFLAPDPVNQRAVYDGVGFIHVLSKEIWDGHPCCAFAASKNFVTQYPNTYRALLKAIVDATAFATKPENRKQIAEAIAPPNYLNQPVTVVEQVLTGTFADGLGNVRKEPNRIDFDPFPYQSFAVWILTQMKRWGQLKGDVDYAKVARDVFLVTDAPRLMTNPVTKCSLYALALFVVLFSSSLFYAQESRFNLVFYSTRDGAANSQIYAMNSDGTHQMRLTNDTANDTDPDISPTGNQIVFTVRPTPTSNTNIFLRDQHGAVRNLTNSTSNNGWARWSPDGRHIAFESDRDGGVYEIYVMDTKYPQDLPRQVTYPPTPSRFPSWSPHGRYIVLRHGIDVAMVNAEGGTPIPLTQEASTSFAQMASWSPNGNYIAFMQSARTPGRTRSRSRILGEVRLTK